MQTYVEEYTDFMTNVRHKALNTVESYKRDVTQYITYLNNSGVMDLSATTKGELDGIQDARVAAFFLCVYDSERNGKNRSDVKPRSAAC